MTPSSPSAKDMGPIERELRRISRDCKAVNGSWWYGEEAISDLVSPTAFRLVAGGANWLTEAHGLPFDLFSPDAWTEAICAASELGL